MKSKLALIMFLLSLMIPLALAQTDAATEVVTDDATMARLRAINLVQESEAVDIYVDGDIALLGSPSRELSNVPVGWVTGFQYLKPGNHSVAVVPTGERVDEAMISEDVTLRAGHRYTVAVMGQKEDASFTPLVIDETAAVKEVRTSPEQTLMLLINNHADLETFSFIEDGTGPKNVPYGGFAAAPIKAGQVDKLVISGRTKEGEVTLAEEGGFYELPGVDIIIANLGSPPDSPELGILLTEGRFDSDLNPLELLKQSSEVGVVWNEGQELSFNTFLSAVETAGLSDMLTTGTHLIFAPTDEAFEVLPDGQLEALLADAEGLADFLRYHIVEGYYPVGSLSDATYSFNDATVTNMQGIELSLIGDAVNDINVSNVPSPTVANGTRVYPVTSVLMQLAD